MSKTWPGWFYTCLKCRKSSYLRWRPSITKCPYKGNCDGDFSENPDYPQMPKAGLKARKAQEDR